MTAIEFENISKQYRLGLVSTKTLSHDIHRFWVTNILGKEDPYLKIGETNDRSKKGESDYVWALKDINFKVEQGEVLGIIGKNGAGKSTLLKLLSKVTGPTTGVIRAKGRIGSLLEVGTGFHPEMTGRENIYMNGAILGMTKAEITRKLDEIIDFSGCERYIDTPVKRYSSGMKVRLGFAVAAHLDPEILVVDEVLAVGDAEFQKKAIGKMQDISSGEGRTVLFVSHNMTSIRNLCNKGILLTDGHVNFQGNIDDVIAKYLEDQDERLKMDIDKISDRRGDGIMKFTDVKYYDANGEEKTIFEVGEEMNIKVFFKATEAFENSPVSRLDVAVYNQFDVKTTWLSTGMFCDKVNCEMAYVQFRMPKVLLTEGTYSINLYSKTNLGMSDYIQNVARFHIVFNDFYKHGKIIPGRQGDMVADYEMV